MWARVSTFEGINDELWPLLRMTAPSGTSSLDPERIRLGERLGRSWLLLGGVVPIDYDDLMLMRVEHGRGFFESSAMLSMRVWEHERSLDPTRAGCIVRDRLAWEPRLPLPLRSLVVAVFRHRHRRLRRRFGESGRR